MILLIKIRKSIGRNYLKNLKQCRREYRKEDISFAELEVLLWAYDLQFFTLKWAAQQLDLMKTTLATGTYTP